MEITSSKILIVGLTAVAFKLYWDVNNYDNDSCKYLINFFSTTFNYLEQTYL